MLRGAVPVLCALLTGCVVPHYVQHRGALVPHPTPVQTTGQPMDRQFGFELGASNLADFVEPRDGSASVPPGIAVAEHQARMAVAAAPTENFHVTGFYEHALEEGSRAISPSLPPLESDPAQGFGFGLDYSVDAGAPGWRVGFAAELTIWNVPYVSYTTETTSGTMTVAEGTDQTGTAAFGMTPSYRSGRWTAYGGVTLRNHPTMLEKASSDLIEPQPDVTGGPLNVVVAAGVELRQDNVALALDVHDALTDDPVHYGPALGLTLRIYSGPRMHSPTPPAPVPPVVMPGPAGGPTSEEQRMRREGAWQLTKQAAAAARAGDCTTVVDIDARVRIVDADFHDTVFMRDIAITRCLSNTP